MSRIMTTGIISTEISIPPLKYTYGIIKYYKKKKKMNILIKYLRSIYNNILYNWNYIYLNFNFTYNFNYNNI